MLSVSILGGKMNSYQSAVFLKKKSLRLLFSLFPLEGIVGRKGEGRDLYEQPECSALMDTVGSSLTE
jgi:hypothetical protein